MPPYSRGPNTTAFGMFLLLPIAGRMAAARRNATMARFRKWRSSGAFAAAPRS
jgi:hypothetical protein